MPRWMRAGRRDERGAVAAVVAILALVLLVSAAFAVDLGGQRAVRSDAQALADVVALDLARDMSDNAASGPCKTSFTPKCFDTQWSTTTGAMALSLNRNVSRLGTTTTSALGPALGMGWICTDPAKANKTIAYASTDAPATPKACVSAVAGTVNSAGAFQAYPVTDDTHMPTAVQVAANGGMPFGFAKVINIGKGYAQRSAVGMAVAPAPTKTPAPCSGAGCNNWCSAGTCPVPTPSTCVGACSQIPSQACTKIGTYLASLKSADSGLLNNDLLNHLFGGTVPLSLTAVGYQGLADSSVTLGQLAQVSSLNVGSVDQLLTTSLTAAQLASAMASVLSSQGNTSAAANLGTIAAGLSMQTSAQIPVANLIDVGLAQGGSAAAIAVNPLDLLYGALTASAQLSAVNGTNLLATGISLPSIAGVASASVYLKVIEAPRIGCFPHEAKTGQVSLVIKLGLASILGVLGGGDVTVELGLGEASAHVAPPLSCSGATPNSMTVELDTLDAVTENIAISNLKLLGITTVNLGVNGSASPTAAAPHAYSLGPPIDYATPVTTSNTGATLPNLSITGSLPLLGGDGNPIGSALTDLVGAVLFDHTVLGVTVPGLASSLLNPIITTVNGLVASTVAPLLGIKLGNVDIWAVKTPVCGTIGLGG